MEIYEEDPVEAYKREFQRKRWEAEQAAKAHKIKYERRAHHFARCCAFFIAIFAFILVLDKYLPRNIYHEVADEGWQERGAGKHPALYSYMQTQSFTFVVPHQAHLDYPYFRKDKPVMDIEVTPIFNIPVHASFTLNDYFYSFQLLDTVHTIFIPLPWLLLISSLFTSFARKYSKLTYAFAFMPLLLLAFVILKMM